MPAQFIKVGEPAHDAERQALRFLVDGLPDEFVVYGNPWLVDRDGSVNELDAVVVAPHAVFVVEIKGYRGKVVGNDHDWYVPAPIRSPLKLNRRTAQILHSMLKRESFEAARAWVEGFVFLSSTLDVNVFGPASNGRVHTRETLHAALRDLELVRRLSGRLAPDETSPATRSALHTILMGGQHTGVAQCRATWRVREYEVVEILESTERFMEVLGRNNLADVERVLRIYGVPPLASDEQRERAESRARWESKILALLGRNHNILRADPPFSDEAGIVLPFERFVGVTLTTWIERHGEALAAGKENLPARIALWQRMVDAIRYAHAQGVVHRLLRPEVILVEDRADRPALRLTGFDLAKRMGGGSTVSLSTISDERLRFAAPEVVSAFSSAEPASDQFSLGALLGLLLAGRPLFDSTRDLLARRGVVNRISDINSRVSPRLDAAVSRMLSVRPGDRFPTLDDAEQEVLQALHPERRPTLALPPTGGAHLDPDNLVPGTRVGADYEILDKLGEGGMAVVYAARHLVSGKVRALKIARPDDGAEDALRGEYRILGRLDHPNIVRVIDLSKMVEGRLTLVMERVGGTTLRRWLAAHPKPDGSLQRRYAEDLLQGLAYLEQQGVTHKDLKPDNLLVGDEGLKIIDFSLADVPEDAGFCGTALYRDPASIRWTHATDRYAAALCLFELYAGRHAFDGRAPEPGEAPDVTAEDIDPPGLVDFFLKALDGSPDLRFPSTPAMRDALLVALGGAVRPPAQPVTTADHLETATDLRKTSLSRRAINQLRHSGVATVGDLLALTETHLRAIHAIGRKTVHEILAFQSDALRKGIQPPPGKTRPVSAEPVLDDALATCPEAVELLALPSTIHRALRDAGFRTVGMLAGATRTDLLAVPGFGAAKVGQVLEALQAFRSRSPAGPGQSVDQVWKTASRPLTDVQIEALDRCVGVTRPVERQGDVADGMAMDQSRVSRLVSEALEHLDRRILVEPMTALEAVMEGLGGIAPLSLVGERLESEWKAGALRGEGLVRLLVRTAGNSFHLLDLDEAEGTILAHPRYTSGVVRRFLSEARRIAEQWPPVEPVAARRNLAAALPEYPNDPLLLAARLHGDIRETENGELFIPPVDPRHSIAWVLEHERLPISFHDLENRLDAAFRGFAPCPDRAGLLEILAHLDYRVDGDQVVGGRSRTVTVPPKPSDALPAVPVAGDRTYEEGVRDLLADAAKHRGFRMVVTPPERHHEIGRSIAAALPGSRWLSFEDLWFQAHDPQIARMERAERFVAQRPTLTRSAEDLVRELLEREGHPGRTLVLGDTAMLGLFNALDLVRRLYDDTLSGERGFWILVLPGVIYQKQPLFNERQAVWHLEGVTVPLPKPLPLPQEAP